MRESGALPCLGFAAATYSLSQAVSWRLFRGILPLEAGSDVFRGGLEESLESLGHLVLLLVTLRALPTDASPEDADAPADRPRTGGSLSLPSSIGGMDKGRT